MWLLKVVKGVSAVRGHEAKRHIKKVLNVVFTLERLPKL